MEDEEFKKALDRKDKEIERLKKENEALMSTLMKREKENVNLSDSLKKINEGEKKKEGKEQEDSGNKEES